VDHNEKSQAVPGIASAEILEIIDHHRLGNIETIHPVFFRNQPLGCTATIITQLYRENGVEIDANTAALLCSAIISDTLMYRSPTCTAIDKATAEELARIADIQVEELAAGMFKAGSNLAEKTEEEIFYQDYKQFIVEKVSLGASQISSMSAEELQTIKARIFPYMQRSIKAGTAKITLTALDGSNKKASCTIKVTNPVSSLSITSGVPRVSDDFFGEMHYAAIGKNVKNTVTFADTYGKPANQKVEWSIAITEWDAEGNYVKHWGELEDQKLITVKNGTLSVKAGVKQYWENIEGKLLITVYADATDGTGVWEAVDYLVVPPATAMKIDNSCKTVTTPTEEQGTAYFYSDQLNRFCTDWNTAFTVTSSNPMIVSFASVEPCEENGWYKITYNTGRKTGSAKFTIKTTDGSNKSCSFTVKVPY